MRDTVSKSKLALRSTSTERFERPENLSDWISGVGREFFYIICKEVRKTVGGKRYYLCVFKPSADGLEEQEYVTGCKLREDRDNPDTHMLFSLIKPRKPKPHPDDNEFVLTPTEGPKDKIVEEGQQLGLTLNKIPKDKISKVGDQIPSERPEDKITEEGSYYGVYLFCKLHACLFTQ